MPVSRRSDRPTDRPSDLPPSDRPRYSARDYALPGGFPIRPLFRGDSFVFDFQVKRPPPLSPPGTPPIPVDLTGYFAWFALKRHMSDPDNQAVALLTSSIGGGVTFVDIPNGRGQAIVPAINTRAFPDGITRLFYALKVQDPNGLDFTAEIGVVDVAPTPVAAI